MDSRVFVERMGLSRGKMLQCNRNSKDVFIDPEGKIVAVDLRGEDLEKKVDSFFNNI